MFMDESGQSGITDDRRVNLRIRGMFVEVYDILEPFFDPANSWGGQLHEHLAFRALHERFPKLSAEEVLVIVTAAKRVFGAGGKPVA
jgi:hypothetical protein